MTRIALRFPLAAFSLIAPAEVLREVERLYPASVAAASPGAPPAAAFRIEAGEDLYRLSGPGLRPRRFRHPRDAALALALELERSVLAARGERLALHAGAVQVGERAWLLAGAADAGKTSCTFQLVELGHAFVCEEIAILDARDRVLPFFQPLDLDGGFLADYRGAADDGRHRRERYLPPRRAAGPVALGAIVLPRYRPGRPPGLARREPEEVVTELLACCFEPLGDEEPFFERVMALAGRLPVHDLTYPDACTARALLERLLAGAPR